MKRQGFTLIELLVVIAVIAVLMGILMPSLRMAREQARSIYCQSNLKTLVLGYKLYAEDNNSKLVNGHCHINGFNPQNPYWVKIPPDGENSTVEEKIEYIKQGALWNYVNNEKVYRCPSDIRKRNAAHSQAYRSYAIAGGLNGQGPSSDIEVCKGISDIKRPSEKYIFLPECDVRGYNRGSWILGPVSGQWIDAFGIYHRGRSTSFGFADGHASKRSWQSQGLVDWNLSAIDKPKSFSFRRDPLLGGSAEIEDWNWAVKGYAYKSLTGPIYRGI